MSISVAGNRGAGSSEDAFTDSVSPSFNAAVAVGKDLLVVGVRVPPNEPVVRDGDNIFVEEMLDCANPPAFSDDKGNTYSHLGSFYYTYPETPDPGGVQPRGGEVIASVHIAKARITTALTTSDKFKVDWGVNGGARAAGSCEVTVGAGKQLDVSKLDLSCFVGLDGTDTTPNLAISGLSGESLFLAVLALAGPTSDGYTADTGGSPAWTAISAPGTSNGAPDATLRWSRRVASVSSESFDPTLGTARKGIAGVVALKEV